MYEASAPVPSYWEATAPVDQTGYRPLEGEQSCDLAVIGGGYTGLSLALHLARDYGIDVRVLEAGHVGWGASGRNGGFCCLSATKMSIEQLISRFGLDETKRFYAAQLEGVDLVRALEDEEGIDYALRVTWRSPRSYAGVSDAECTSPAASCSISHRSVKSRARGFT